MKAQRLSLSRFGLFLIAAVWLVIVVPVSAMAAPYAAYVIDARSGKVIHSRNADTRLHPASLTKMMTLYIAFQAIERGEISLDTKVTITKKAAAEPPSKLGLRAGQKIALRYLIRGAAVKSANDAATAIGEAISGSEARFARRMNRTAKQLGMTRTTFKNMHGIKTGYTRAAGYNLTASAERGRERIIVTVFGGKTTSSRNARVAELMDLGFRRAPSRARIRKPAKPAYIAEAPAPRKPVPNVVAGSTAGGAGKTIRLSGAVKKSIRPKLRPGAQAPVLVAAAETPAPVSNADITAALREAVQTEAPKTAPAPQVTLAAVNTSVLRPKLRRVAPKPKTKKVVQQEIVTRVSTSGGRHWGVNVGRFPSRFAAEKVLLKTALAEMSTLDGSLRKVVKRSQGFDANFLGMSRETADLACRRLAARNVSCFMIGPS